MRLRNQQTGHQLGQRSNRQHGLIVLAQQHFMRILVNHIGYAGLQIERVGDGMQASHLTVGLTRWLNGCSNRTGRQCSAACSSTRLGQMLCGG